MITRRTLRLALACLLVGALLGTVAPVGGAPPPRPVCDACGDSFEATAQSHGVPLTIENSTATVGVHKNGSATWVIHNVVAGQEPVDRLRANRTTLTAIAEDAMWDSEFREVTIAADGIITLRYHQPDFATRAAGGGLRSGAFTEAYGYDNLAGLGADRLTVLAPDGMQIGWAVPGASVADDGSRMTITELTEEGFVTFVPRGAVLGPLYSLLGVGAFLVPAVIKNTLAYIALPTGIFALLIGGLAGGSSRVDWEFDRIRERAGLSLGLFGVLVALGSVIASIGGTLIGGPTALVFGGGMSLVALGVLCSRSGVRDRLTYWRLVGMAIFGVAFAVASTAGGSIVFGPETLSRFVLARFPFLVPVFLLLPTGYALGRENRRLAIATAAIGFAIAMIPLTPFTAPTIGLGVLIIIAAMVYAVSIPIVGFPLLVVGVSLGEQAPVGQ